MSCSCNEACKICEADESKKSCWFPLLVAGILAIILMAASAGMALAQGTGTWVGECTTAKPCILVGDPPPEATQCVLIGAPPSIPTTVQVVDKSTIAPPPGVDMSLVKQKTCWWPNIVLAPGTYRLTAIVRDAAGRTSDPSSPLAVTVLAPLAAPTGLMLYPAQ